ncbi:hypothetical protein LTR16_000735 [Cryomyces antarcticus]|uniref:Uncharacterized protein n=1 Tax=Cryomyces antarcticus TaxID=329879 RepID=A0ABR0LQR7_9PEZI|nr:hypothetical protein LTR39_001229 [Cryomyces antarcticus]KAK5202001.1 hypothetical protein LTR16_000735 [Cryomyces antarcticus]
MSRSHGMLLWSERRVAVERRPDRTEAGEAFGAGKHRARTPWLRTMGIELEREFERQRHNEQASQAATDKKAIEWDSAQAREGWEKEQTARPPQDKPKEQTEPQPSEATKVWSEEIHRKKSELLDEWLEAARETRRRRKHRRASMSSLRAELTPEERKQTPKLRAAVQESSKKDLKTRRERSAEAWHRLQKDNIAFEQMYRILTGDEDTPQRRREKELRAQCEGGLAPEEMERILWLRAEMKVVEEEERLAEAKRQA